MGLLMGLRCAFPWWPHVLCQLSSCPMHRATRRCCCAARQPQAPWALPHVSGDARVACHLFGRIASLCVARARAPLACRRMTAVLSKRRDGDEGGPGGKKRKGGGRRFEEDEDVITADDIELTEDIGGGVAAGPSSAAPARQLQRRRAGGEGGGGVGDGGRGLSVAVLEQEQDGERQLWGGRRETRSGGEGQRTSTGRRPTFRGPREKLALSGGLAQRQAISNEIKGAADWRALAAFLDARGAVMDAEHASLVLAKLSCCPPGPGGRKPLDAPAFARPPTESDAAGALEYDRLLSTLLGWILTLVPSFRPRQVANCLASMSYMELWNLEVVTALKDMVLRQSGNFEASEYATIAAALAKFGYSPGEEFMQMLMRKSLRKLPAMSAVDLGKISSALAKLGCIPPQEWASAFWQASADKSGEFLDATAGGAARSLFMAAGKFAQAGVQPPQEWVDAVFGAYVVPGARRVPIPTLNVMLYALSNLNCKPTEAQPWFAHILGEWRTQLMFCTPSDLGNISLYLGRYLQVAAPRALCTKLLRTTLEVASKMRGDDLAAVAYLLGASEFKATDRDVGDLVQAINARLGECTPSGLEMVYMALPRLGDSPQLREVVDEAARGYNASVAPPPPPQEVQQQVNEALVVPA